jgi:hypothetical protein
MGDMGGPPRLRFNDYFSGSIGSSRGFSNETAREMGDRYAKIKAALKGCEFMNTLLPEILSLDQMKQRYHDEWLLIAYTGTIGDRLLFFL